MMTNLFSIFDSNTNNFFEMNWLSSILNMLIFPMIYWFSNSRLIFLMKMILMMMNMEIKIIMKIKFNYLNSIFFISLFLFILLNNFMGIIPMYFYCLKSYIFSLSFSLPLWFSLMIFLWTKNYSLAFAHMIPQGIPNILMPFMVLIETISNLIRPMTLSIRLTANMIAGHLLLTLLSETANSNLIFIMIFVIMIQMMLLILEFSVSIIQSYVFTILSTLYTKETN
uniref:ATP synthase subunit a n=1 Tax=Diadegma semiclausum TaxID=208481 RepID=C4N022_DIASM|nr:ATP synthase F0 subunit 6 [Diadegma semiclausum]ACF35060.1 ATP synthase F0 subunit 6 [Diadegma semiclausum]